MIRLLERAAQARPGQLALLPHRLTYGDLLADAQRVAAAFDARSITRVAIVEADAAWVIRLLAGAALAGVESCQYQPDTPVPKLATYLDALEHDVVVTSRPDLVPGLSSFLGGGTDRLPGVTVVRPQALLSSAPKPRAEDDDEAPRPQPLLIRTTGTTGAPKAARHDWEVLARAVAQVEPRPEQRWLLAYGAHQFAGIQVLLHTLAAQATLVAPFPRQPRDGLQSITEHGVTCVSATPTYWRFLLAEARAGGVELPALEQITLGGEASPPDLLAELRERFPHARISQVYASTELGSITSVRDGRPGLDAASLFGPDNPDANLRVIDGELWVRPATEMQGYAGADEAESRTWGGEWRPTGDLVEVEGDRVLFRGRTSEVINVGGVKVHPLPVEQRVLALDGVAAARVFGRANRLTGAIVAVEVVPADGATLDEETLRRTVKDAVSDLPRAWHPRSIAIVDELATQGGKTVRRHDG